MEKMVKSEIIELLKDYNQEEVERFASYCIRMLQEKDKKTGWLKNSFMQTKSSNDMAVLYKRVANEWLVFDWIHIIIQNTWISYDYVALKNKMLLAYPESIIDVQLVSNKDTIEFSKESWKVSYSHKIWSPFDIEDKDIIWAYCVIKNIRWEFLTTINSKEIEKHKQVAKTTYIWNAWFKEMVLKTIIKKACKSHFNDIYAKILEEDDKQNDIELWTEKINEEKQKEKEKDLNSKYNLWESTKI